MGREQPRFRRRRSRNPGRGRGDGSDTKDRRHKSSTTTGEKKKTLSDHTFHFGTAKKASEYATNKKFIFNHIRKTYKEAEDIAEAMEKGVDMNFTAIAPTVKPIMADPKADPTGYETQTQMIPRRDNERSSESQATSSTAPTHAKTKSEHETYPGGNMCLAPPYFV